MAEISTGITITFDSGFFAEILSINQSGMTRGSIDVTHMGSTGAREFMPSTLVENGTVDISVLQPGMYIVEVTIENTRIRQKLLVQR